MKPVRLAEIKATQFWTEGQCNELVAAAEANVALREALEGMLHEWDTLTRYGSPMATAANERVAYARRVFEATSPAAARDVGA